MQTRLIRDLLYGFAGSQFVVILYKDQKTLSLQLKRSAVYIWIICFSRIVKLTQRVFFVVTVRPNKVYFALKFYLCNVFTSGQDEFLELAR